MLAGLRGFETQSQANQTIISEAGKAADDILALQRCRQVNQSEQQPYCTRRHAVDKRKCRGLKLFH